MNYQRLREALSDTPYNPIEREGIWNYTAPEKGWANLLMALLGTKLNRGEQEAVGIAPIYELPRGIMQNDFHNIGTHVSPYQGQLGFNSTPGEIMIQEGLPKDLAIDVYRHEFGHRVSANKPLTYGVDPYNSDSMENFAQNFPSQIDLLKGLLQQ